MVGVFQVQFCEDGGTMDGFKKMMGWLPVNPEYRTEWKLGPEEVARGPGSETNENRWAETWDSFQPSLPQAIFNPKRERERDQILEGLRHLGRLSCPTSDHSGLEGKYPEGRDRVSLPQLAWCANWSQIPWRFMKRVAKKAVGTRRQGKYATINS